MFSVAPQFSLARQVTSASADQLDVLAVVDALYRFGLGQDQRHQPGARELFRSAFTEDAVLDFRPAATAIGLEVPLMTGREMITDIILAPTTRIDTTHVVTNPRVDIRGDDATMTALVEAQHLPTDDHSRHALLKNLYQVEARRVDGLWRMHSVLIDCVWFTGDPQVITGS